MDDIKISTNDFAFVSKPLSHFADNLARRPETENSSISLPTSEEFPFQEIRFAQLYSRPIFMEFDRVRIEKRPVFNFSSLSPFLLLRPPLSTRLAPWLSRQQ